MSRIVITTMGSLGDLHPQMAIAIELQRRGHDVVFATHEGYREKIEAIGLKFHQIRPDSPSVDDKREVAQMMDLKTGTEYIIRQWLLPNLRQTYHDLLASAQDADLIVTGSVVFATPLVAEKLGIPWVVSVLQPATFFSAYDPSIIALLPFLAKSRGWGVLFNRAVVKFIKALAKSWAAPIHQLRKELDLKPAEDPVMFMTDKNSPDLVLALFSEVLAKPQPDWPQKTILTGFTFYDDDPSTAALTPELQQFLAAGAAPIIFTLGSAAVITPGTFYQESIQAAKILQRRAILLIGKNPPPDQLTTEIIAIDYLPYSQIFPQAAVIVHQGGVGTTAQALRSGHPTLIMPYSHDQPDNAARVARLGTSRTIERQHYAAARVAQELKKLLENPSYAAKAQEIGAILQPENGTDAACDAIIQQLHK